MNKICGIYKITSPTKKIYIGQSINIKKRFHHYKILACKDQSRLYNSLKKHGVEKHKFEILQVCEREQLNELEVYYIELFQCFDSKYGLNLRSGGNQYKQSEETKQKISIANKGRKLSIASRKNMSNGQKGKIFSVEHRKKISEANNGNKHPMFGKYHSIESKQKMSQSHSGENNPVYGKHLTEEHRRNIGKGNKGKIRTNETKNKLSIINKGKTSNRKGVILSEETKRKISESNKGKKKIRKIKNILI